MGARHPPASFEDVVAFADQRRAACGSYSWPEDAAAAAHVAASSAASSSGSGSSLGGGLPPGARAAFPEDSAAGEGLQLVSPDSDADFSFLASISEASLV